jgi:hypothetical protein
MIPSLFEQKIFGNSMLKLLVFNNCMFLEHVLVALTIAFNTIPLASKKQSCFADLILAFHDLGLKYLKMELEQKMQRIDYLIDVCGSFGDTHLPQKQLKVQDCCEKLGETFQKFFPLWKVRTTTYFHLFFIRKSFLLIY